MNETSGLGNHFKDLQEDVPHYFWREDGRMPEGTMQTKFTDVYTDGGRSDSPKCHQTHACSTGNCAYAHSGRHQQQQSDKRTHAMANGTAGRGATGAPSTPPSCRQAKPQLGTSDNQRTPLTELAGEENAAEVET